MNTAITNAVSRSKSHRRHWLAAAVMAGLGGLALAAPARAGDRGDRFRDDDRLSFRIGTHDYRHGPRFDERPVPVWVEPVYRTVCDKVWIEPVHEVRSERVWVEPVVKEVCEKVWVPERCETRRVVTHDRHGHHVFQTRHVVVEPGHYEERHRQVVVKPGCWENVERRVCVREGHWTTVERQELVTPGHYVTRVERMPYAHRHEPRRGFEFDLAVNLGR